MQRDNIVNVISIVLVLAIFSCTTRLDLMIETRAQDIATSVQLTTVVRESNRAKTGPSWVQPHQRSAQTTPPAMVMAGGAFDTERRGFAHRIRV